MLEPQTLDLLTETKILNLRTGFRGSPCAFRRLSLPLPRNLRVRFVAQVEAEGLSCCCTVGCSTPATSASTTGDPLHTPIQTPPILQTLSACPVNTCCQCFNNSLLDLLPEFLWTP
eukprot:1188642-Prorocentrum_minimum.AAC.3